MGGTIGKRRRVGITLLEVLLALALSVVVMTAIGMAINLHFKMLDARRTSIEEMQTVRVIAARMANDIRTIVHPIKPDLSGIETAYANAMQAAVAQATAAAGGETIAITSGGGGQGGGGQGGGQGTGGGGQSQSGGGGGQDTGGGQGAGGQGAGGQSAGGQSAGGQGQGGGQQSGSSQQAGGGGGASGGGTSSSGAGAGAASSSGAASSTGTSGSGTETASTTASSSPAVQLIGSAYELRFDISRLPRIDQYQSLLSQGQLSATELPSDVKTIVYFLRSETSATNYAQEPTAAGGEASTDGYGRGLMRAELDRAVTSYSETGGTTDGVYANAQLLAEEVTGLEFQYYDGTEWLTEWDSSSQGLPRSIKIWLSIKATYGMTEEQMANAAQGQVPEEISFYTYVNLPTTPLVAPAAESTTTESGSTTDSSGAAASSSSSSSSTTQGATP